MSDTDSKGGCALTVGSLFSGIGGLDLGFERAGFEIAWQCEKDTYCQKVLNKHWPNTPCYDDVTDLHRASGPTPEADILIGGFPCQDISLAGEGAGLDGERSGLWWEYCRLIRTIRPRYAVVENVSALVRRGLRAILGALAQSGYDAEWQVVSAASMGAPHIRERLFLVAYPNVGGRRASERRIPEREPNTARSGEANADTAPVQRKEKQWDEPDGDLRRNGEVADPSTERCNQRAGLRPVFEGCVGRGRPYNRNLQAGRKQWKSEPRVGRLADGVPDRVDRLRGLGNAVVPQVAQFVAECVQDHYARTRHSTTNGPGQRGAV